MSKKVLVVDDEKLIRWSLGKALREWGYEPISAATKKEAIAMFDAEEPIVTFLDINLPDGSGIDVLRDIKRKNPEAIAVMITANVLVDDTIAALRAGAYDFISKPINLDEIRVTIRNAIETLDLRTEVRGLRHEKSVEYSFSQIIGESPPILELKEMADRVATSDVSGVLLQGESGTGKDLIAKAIHFASGRAHKPFIAINCAAIPATLMESELFGYEKGAFTDAKQRKEGLFEQAAGGTLFLDEIGEMEIALQAKLLRVLEEGVFRRVGGLRDIELDVRVIAASNRDLKEESETGRFRADLYYRLSVIQLDVPPLRSRGDDIIRLAEHFIRVLSRGPRAKDNPRLSPEVKRAFKHHEWRGNVRELRNAIDRALILETGDEITLRFLPKEIVESLENHSVTSESEAERNARRSIKFPREGLSLDAVETVLIQMALERTNGNITRAGELLGISRDRVRYKLKKMGSKST